MRHYKTLHTRRAMCTVARPWIQLGYTVQYQFVQSARRLALPPPLPRAAACARAPHCTALRRGPRSRSHVCFTRLRFINTCPLCVVWLHPPRPPHSPPTFLRQAQPALVQGPGGGGAPAVGPRPRRDAGGAPGAQIPALRVGASSMAGGDGASVDRSPIIPGPGELNEAAPLKARGAPSIGGGGPCVGGPRLILACFAALSAAITLALFTQIYYNDYEVVPHGGVSCDAAACALAGTDALKAGGRALDAAAAAALCLAVLAPHTTSLDASGSLLYWEYRGARAGGGGPQLAEWGPGAGPGAEAPRLLAALAALHAAHGALPWRDVLQPAVSLAKSGFEVGARLAEALAAAGGAAVAGGTLEVATGGARASAPRLAAYLEELQRNTSAELSAAWGAGAVRVSAAAGGAAGGGRAYVGGPRAGGVQRALHAALSPPPATLDEAEARAVAALQAEGTPAPGGVATGLAVIDSEGAYVALVTGLSVPFGSGAVAAGGAWRRDVPPAPLDLTPAILVDEHVCGTRYVVGAARSDALAAVGAALAAGGGAGAVELARPPAAGGAEGAAVNVLQQSGDALLSHADSRGGGLASRF